MEEKNMLRELAHFGRLAAEGEYVDWRLRKKAPLLRGLLFVAFFFLGFIVECLRPHKKK